MNIETWEYFAVDHVRAGLVGVGSGCHRGAAPTGVAGASTPASLRCWAVMGLSQEEASEKFGFLLDAFNYGPPPHGGIAFGWDRICALLSGMDSIREVIAFPKSGGGVDPLTDAPAPITAQQRKEAGVDAPAVPAAAAAAQG